MLRVALLFMVTACAAPTFCAESVKNGSLMPKGIRAIATPDDAAIIIVSDSTNGAGKGLDWLGVNAIPCNADNSIIVWTGSYAPQIAPPMPVRPIPMPRPPVAPSTSTFQGNKEFIWPEGVDNAVPFDLDNSIVSGSEIECFRRLQPQ